LLRERFPEAILVPEAVWREVVDEGAERLGDRELSAANWIKIQKINDKRMVRLLRAAMRMGLKVLGTAGVLLWGKQMGKFVSLREHLDALRFQGMFRISQRLYDRVVQEAGEE